ncbi:MAG: redox-regulated ATPase YchF, partial [Thermoanaerobacteraceae bacterium]|nr:redox-regulated ATPase YchF [Thermoanaerobacteraceae bacterium]
ITPTTIEFVDIAGLVKGASRGEGLGNKFLSHIRQVDATVHVVRCFDDPNVVHVDGKVDPIRDIEVINLELIFADLESLEKRLERVRKQAKSRDKQSLAELSVLERVKEALEQNIPARSLEFAAEEQEIIKHLFLLTSKPVIYVANISEDDLLSSEENEYVKKVKEYAAKEGAEVITIAAKIEAELAELAEQEKKELLAEYALEEPGLERLIKSGYKLLGLITFFTLESKEVRAWTITKGTKAPQAAGKIHTDFERGFIRAEVMDYNVLVAHGSQQAVREKGLLRSEGKEYIVKDGDVILFRFNV